MDSWKTSNRRVVLQSGRFLTVEYHTVELPDGTLIPDWSWVITPDFINAVVVDQSGRFVLFRQGKYAYQGLSLAPVGGYLEPGEDPLSAAKREVLEEAGYQSERWIDLGSYTVDANRGAGTAHAFLALDAWHVGQGQSDDLEEQELLLLTRAEVEQALFNRDFKVLPWANLIALTLLHIDRHGS